MAREPHDIFMREFFQHPGWEEVFQSLQGLSDDLRDRIIGGESQEFNELRGRFHGANEAISHLKGLLRKYSKG